MTAFLSALGGKLADTWLSLLVLPGLLFVSLAAVGHNLGHRHALDLPLLVRRINTLAADPAAHAPGTIALLAVLVLAASAGASLVASALAGAVERLWLGDWPRPLSGAARTLTARRVQRWDSADERHRTALRDKADRKRAARDAGTDPELPEPAATPAPAASTAPAPGQDDTRALNEARNRIALAHPDRPTWMGDRIHAVESRVHEHYGLDVASAWPRLWLLLPEAPRADLQSARTALTTAARRAAWGALCLLLGLWWWPAAIAGAVAYLGAWRQGRLAVDVFAELVEATVDLHGRELAAALGIPCEAALTPEVGVRITRTVRKGT
ncbi:hypothetical protein ACIHCQ_18450 [Streptomyces sp. NPDC052236]|uniref:hypothetical protein n=1 Tax=Streptomyces sp. NPDC052236 TaxID=3365686 RepID=UPI0037D8A2E3